MYAVVNVVAVFPLLNLTTRSPASLLVILLLTAVTDSPLSRTIFGLHSGSAQQLENWIARSAWELILRRVDQAKKWPCVTTQTHFLGGLRSADFYHRHSLTMILRSTLLHFYMFEMGCKLQLICHTLIGNVSFFLSPYDVCNGWWWIRVNKIKDRKRVNKAFWLKRLRKGFEEELASALAACGSARRVALLFWRYIMWKLRPVIV